MTFYDCKFIAKEHHNVLKAYCCPLAYLPQIKWQIIIFEVDMAMILALSANV
jgi:hypothetical protein